MPEPHEARRIIRELCTILGCSPEGLRAAIQTVLDQNQELELKLAGLKRKQEDRE